MKHYRASVPARNVAVVSVLMAAMLFGCAAPPPPPPQLTITKTGGPTASQAQCGNAAYTVETIITNHSSVPVILSATAPTQIALTAGTSSGLGRIEAGGATTVKTPVTLGDVCNQGTLGMIFVAGDANDATNPNTTSETFRVTIGAQPLNITAVNPVGNVPANANTGAFNHGMSFACCAAGAHTVVWTPTASTGVPNGMPGPPGGQVVNCAGAPLVPNPLTINGTGNLSANREVGVTSFNINRGGVSCLHSRNVIRQ